MGLMILLVLFGIPALEIFVFAEIGGIIGGWTTAALTLATAALGALMFRRQGTMVLARARDTLSRQQSPLAEIVDGTGLLLAAGLLFLPGFITDMAGFLLFIPPLRLVVIGYLFRRFLPRDGAGIHIVTGTGEEDIIDGHYEDLTPGEEPRSRRPHRDRSSRGEGPDDLLPPR